MALKPIPKLPSGGDGPALILAIIGQTRLYSDCLARALTGLKGVAIIPLDLDHVAPAEAPILPCPDVILIDLPEKTVYKAVRELRPLFPKCALIGLNVEDDDEAILRLLEIGVDGFLVKQAPFEALQSAIEGGVRGELHCSTEILMRLARKLGSRRARLEHSRPLSPRESDVIRLVEQGFTNKEIAARLGVEAATVKNHVHHIMAKLAVHRRMDAVAQLRPADVSPKGHE